MKKDYGFFAFIDRMKYINRWGLMKNTMTENLKEHSFDVAIIAHCLCVIGNTYFEENINSEKAVTVALFHDSDEIITGDLPTPVKYLNNGISSKYKEIERLASDKLISHLPDEMKTQYKDIFFEEDEKIKKIVKAADKLSALIKCSQEIYMGNKDFQSAYTSTLNAVKNLNMKEVDFFLKNFFPSFEKTLDQISL